MAFNEIQLLMVTFSSDPLPAMICTARATEELASACFPPLKLAETGKTEKNYLEKCLSTSLPIFSSPQIQCLFPPVPQGLGTSV